MALCAGKSRPGRASRTLGRLAIPNRTRQRLIVDRFGCTHWDCPSSPGKRCACPTRLSAQRTIVGRPLWLHALGLPIFFRQAVRLPYNSRRSAWFSVTLIARRAGLRRPFIVEVRSAPLWQVNNRTTGVEIGRTSIVGRVRVDGVLEGEHHDST